MNNILIRLLFTLIVLFDSYDLIAKTTLLIPTTFNVISVNGQPHTETLSSQSNLLKLQAGTNKIGLEYKVSFESKKKKLYKLVKSDIFIIRVYLQANQQYKLQYLKQLNAQAAKKYIKKPIISIITTTNQTVLHQQYFPVLTSKNSIHLKTKIIKHPIERLEIISNRQ